MGPVFDTPMRRHRLARQIGRTAGCVVANVKTNPSRVRASREFPQTLRAQIVRGVIEAFRTLIANGLTVPFVGLRGEGGVAVASLEKDVRPESNAHGFRAQEEPFRCVRLDFSPVCGGARREVFDQRPRFPAAIAAIRSDEQTPRQDLRSHEDNRAADTPRRHQSRARK